MKISFSSISLSHFNQFVNRLSPFQKKVISVALACISIMTLAYLIKRIWDKKVSHQQILQNASSPVTSSIIGEPTVKQNESITDCSVTPKTDMEILFEQGKIIEAWNKYVAPDEPETSNQIFGLTLNFNKYQLPPEQLVNQIIDLYDNKTELLQIMPVEFLRDCALKYPEIKQRLLDEDILWNCIASEIDCVLDLCQSDKNFAKEIILSKRVENIDFKQLEIFKAAYRSIYVDMRQRMSDEMLIKVKWMCQCLIKHMMSVDDLAYKELTSLVKYYEGRVKVNFHPTDKKILALLKLVEKKWRKQGIYNDQGRVTSPDIHLNHDSSDFKFMVPADYMNEIDRICDES